MVCFLALHPWYIYPSHQAASACRPSLLSTLSEPPPCSWKQHGGWFNHVKARAAEIADLGFTVIWLPPFTQSVSNEVRAQGGVATGWPWQNARSRRQPWVLSCSLPTL